jgi:[NiFe] hydrogenase diaphorase moiety small subunit
MSDPITFTIDGVEVRAAPGQKILEAAEAAGIYIPRLCWMKELTPGGSCRLCTVLVNGRPLAACTQPVANGLVVENDIPELHAWRKQILEMLFVEGNHVCPVCEKSGDCRLQALAYRHGITAPRYPFLFPRREVDAGHPDFFLDRNRCVLCGLCVRASRELDGKSVFGFVGRGPGTRIAMDAEAGLGATDFAAADRAAAVCPVGAILRKRVGYAVPVGKRRYDGEPIGSDVEGTRPPPAG